MNDMEEKWLYRETVRGAAFSVLASVLLLGVASCGKEVNEEVPGTETLPGAVKLTARIADETRATLSEDTGKFAFSAGDQIKVFDGTTVYASTGVNLSDDDAEFTMPDGFNNSTGSGFAGFPAGMVDNITSSGVTFNLPTTYSYAQVGGADASAAKVPCPMIATYTAGQDLIFKQAGAVIRFRIKECVEGDITFTFTTAVTGRSVPERPEEGIVAQDLSSPGYSITVTGVPAVTGDDAIFITLPVPVGTDPMNVGVWNHGSSINKVASLRNATSKSLSRADGYKRAVTLTDVKDAAKFNGHIMAGDLYYNYNNGYEFGIMEDPLEVLKYYSVDYTTSDNTSGNGANILKCYFKWKFFSDTHESFNFSIGGKDYRVPSSGQGGDWEGIAGTTSTRPTANVKGNDTRYAYVTVTGLNNSTYHTDNIGGLLLFPDNAIIAVPVLVNSSKLAVFSADDKGENIISHSELNYLLDQGCSFIPTAGFWQESKWYYLYWDRGWYGINEVGSYWSTSSFDSSTAYALTILRNHTQNSPRNLIDPKAYDNTKDVFYPVRLIREN